MSSVTITVSTVLQFVIALLLAGLAWNMNQLNQRLTALEQLRDRLMNVEAEVKGARMERMQQLTAVEVSILRMEKNLDRLSEQLEQHMAKR